MTDHSDGDENDRKLWRLAAGYEIQALEKIRELSFEQNVHAFKWLTGSLLVINAGGAIAAINSEFLTAHSKLLAGTIFGVGILLSLSIAVAAQKFSMHLIPKLQQQIGYWLGVSVDGERLESLEEQNQSDLKEQIRRAWIVPALGWISALAFVAGSVSVGFGLVEQESRKTDKTASIQGVGAGKQSNNHDR
jgi:hypothetical protein